MDQKSYIYFYLDPRECEKFCYSYRNHITLFYEPFYVGKGQDDRQDDHLKEAKNLIKSNRSDSYIEQNCTNPNKIKRILDIIKDGLNPIITKVLINVSDQQAKDYEIILIDKIGRYDKNRGPLTNMTDGGEGAKNALGKKWFNNGEIQRLYYLGEEPENWILGFLSGQGKNNPMYGSNRSGALNPMFGKKSICKDKSWYTNGIDENLYYLDKHPNGWEMGRLPISENTRNKLSDSTKGQNNPNYGKKIYNNGIKNKFFRYSEVPNGWVLGALYCNVDNSGKNNPCYGKRMYNNGEIQKFFDVNELPPEGWNRGKLKR